MHHSTKERLTKSIREQQEFLRSKQTNYFHELSTSPEMKSLIAANMTEYRDRVFSPTVVLRLFLQQILSADKSCEHAVLQYHTECIAHAIPTSSANTAAYCKARLYW